MLAVARWLDHLCAAKVCWNPDHLEVVTRGENTRRAADRNPAIMRRRNATKCINGHPYDDTNTIVKTWGRVCRTCQNEAAARYRRKKKVNS